MVTTAKHARVPLWGLFAILVVVLFSVDGEISQAAAIDRWVGTANLSALGFSVPVGFTVLVNPGKGASWEWRFQGTPILTGPLSASVSGSRVTGTLFSTGGAAFEARI